MLTFNNPFNVDDASNASLELNGATGVTTAVVNGTTYVFVAGNVDDGISVFSVAANGTLTNVFNIDDASNAALELDGAIRLTTAVVGGATYLFSTGNVDDGISVFSVANNGALTNVFNVDDAGSAALLDAATGIATGLSGTNRYLIVTSIANDAVNVFSVAANGALTFVSSTVDNGTLELDGAAAVTTAIVGGITYVFVAGSVDDGVSTFRLNVDGTLTNIAGGNVTDAGALELDGAQTLTTAVVGGTTYLFVGGSPDEGISVFSVAANGNLTNVFNVTDDATLKLLGVTDLTTAVVNGTTYLYAAGSGDAGVSVFSVANNGALTNAANIADAGSLELQGVAGVTTATINANTYVIAAGSTDDGVSVLNQAPVLGQLWYVTEGGNSPAFSDARVAYINDDSSDATTRVDNTPTLDLGSGFVEEVVLDTAAGLYYIRTGAQGINSKILMGHIGNAAAPTVVFTFDPTFAGTENNLAFGMHLDPISHKIYVGFIDFANFVPSTEGIRQFTYNTSTGAVTDNGLIATQTTAQIQPSAAGATPLFIPRDFDIDYTHGVIYATQFTLGDGFETNTLVRLNLANPGGSAAVSVINQAFFALDGDGSDFPTLPNGVICDVEVDQASDRIFFATHQEAPDGSGALGLHDEDDAIWVITNASTAVNVTPTKVTLSGIPGAATLFYPEDIVLDEVNNILYVESEQVDGSGASDDIILVFQLTSDTTATYIKTISPTFNDVANIQGMFFDELATIANVNGTATHAVEQVTVLDLLTSAPTIADFESDHLNNATVTISNSFVGSGDQLYVLDGAAHKTSGTFTGIPAITISQTTDGNGNLTLTLTGYGTFAEYQTILNAVAFTANGDNPTNYGYNTTRTISWQVNDGAADNPSGTPNGTTTNLRTTTVTIDAVNDAPQNNLPGTPSVNEDVQTAITGISITDVDADPANQDITVTFSVSHGTLNLLTNVLNGIQASDITGGAQDSNSITITSTQNQINNTIAGLGLRYTSDLNFNSNIGLGAETLHIVTSDNGNTGTPGALGDIDNLIINVLAVNDNPNLQPDTTSAVGYIENAAPTALFSLENVDTPLADVDQNANYAGGSIDLNITAGLVSGDRINLTGARFAIVAGAVQDTANGNAVVGAIGATNGTSHVTISALTAAATPAVVDALLKSFGYDSTSDNPGAGDRTITLTFNDGGNTGSGGALTDAVTQTVHVTPVNDAPVSTITPPTYSATEQVALSLKNNGLAVSDVDGNAGSETITLSVTEGTLTVAAGTSGVSIDSGNGTGSVTISGTIAQLNDFLNTNAGSTISYIDNTDTPSASATLTLLIHDNGNSGTPPPGDLSAQDTATINITAVNDAPVALLGTDPYAATENVALNIKNTGMSASDVDAGSAVVTATLSVTQGILNVTAGSSGVTNVTGDGTGSVTITGTLAAINALLNTDGTSTVSYTETNDNPSATVTLTLQINDQGNTGTGGAQTGSDTSTINITPQNDAPIATITPTTYAATEQVALSLKNNGLAVSDVDGNAGSQTVTLSVTEGILNVTAGGSGALVSNSGTSSVTITGTIVQINALLNTDGTSTVSYIDNTDTPSASASLTLLIHDNGNTGGGDLTSQDNATINLTAVNDAPTALMTTDPYAATENVALNIKNTGMSVSDVDAGSAVVTATLSVTQGILNVTAGSSGVTNVTGDGTGSVTVTGTLAAINALLNTDGTSTVSYTETNDNPSATVTLTLQIDDQGNTGTGGALTGNDTSTINLTAVNDAPVATITPTAYTGAQGVSINLKNSGLSVSDVDGNAGSETVTLSVTSGTLTVTAGGSGAGVAGNGTSSVTITGTIAQINALLNTDGTSTVSFLDAVGGSKTLTLLIHDNGNTGGGDLSGQDTAAINLGDAPVLVDSNPAAGDNPTFIENGAVVTAITNPASPAILISDADAPGAGDQINKATIKITGGLTAGDVLGADTTGTGITASWDGVDTLTLTGPDTIADFSAVLHTVTFQNTGEDPTNGGANATRTLSWTVFDILNIPSNVDTTSVNVTAVNDGPAAVITPTTFSATEQTTLNLKAAGLSVSDVDANTGSVTVTLLVAEGTLTVTAGGSGAVVANSGTSSVTLTGTLAQINALLTTDGTSTVSFIDNIDNPSASATLTLAINDNGNTGGGDLTSQDNATINITAVNDGPAATITPAAYNATENVTLNLKTNGLSVSDNDGNAGSETVTLSVTEGILNVTAGGSGALVTNSGTGAVTITGTVAQINALLNTDGTSTVAYVETDDTPSATATLTLAIHDNGNTGGGDLSAQDTATINITAVNDAPVIGNLTPSIPYVVASPPQTLSPGATVTDPDTPNLVSASVTLTNHQAGDELSVNGAVIGGPVNGISWSYNAGTGVLSFIGPSSLANYQALLDTVQYRSTSGDPSNGGTTLTRDVAWVVNDGTDPSVTQHTSISLGNQAPTVDLNGGGGGTNADQPFFEGGGAVGVASALLSIADADDANLTSATIVLTNAKAGDTLSINGALPGGITSAIDTSVAGQITVTLSGIASKANYTAAIQQVVFNNGSDNPDTTDRQITVTVNDGEDNSNSAITTVHVGGVNDGPINGVPATQNIEANTATAIGGLSVADPDSAGAAITTTLSVAHGTLTVASAGGAAVGGSGTGTVTLTGSVAAINTTLSAANNVVYKGAHDFFGTDTLTVLSNDLGNTGTGGALTDTDNVTLNVNTLITGTTGNDSYNALPGQERIDAGLGIDTIAFNFKLVDASVKYEGNKVIIDGPTGSHTVLTGFEVFTFTDGTVHNDDGSPLIDDLFYYSKYHDVWNAHIDADAHYNSVGWHEGRDPDAFFSTVVYLSANPDVKTAGVNPLTHFDTSGWKEGRVPSINFDPAQYLAANPDVAAANVDPLRHFLANGAQEGRQPFSPSELVTANGFDYVYYLNHNPDVAAAGVDPFQHFETVGWQEGRNPNALFDTNGYLANYADVAAAHVNPLDHYNQFGWHEGRDPSVGFDTTSYLAAYADVNAANVNPLTHFLHFGIHEGRSPFADGIWG
jgi:6-phosphogluconolactonase (cycloisomerase 2 family)